MHETLLRTVDGQILLKDHVLCATSWRWLPAKGAATGATPVSARAAMQEISATCGLHPLVVGVIGPRAATREQLAAAEEVGRQLGALGLTVICGGRSGVMEATCKGVAEAGGRPVGILPGTDPSEANPHVAIPLTTGLAEARNIIIVRAARVLVAVGNSPGTLTEVAYGLHFSKPVIGVAGAAELDGVHQTPDAEAAVETALSLLLAGLPRQEVA